MPDSVDEKFPWLADVAQQALNTQNHVSTEVSELETALVLYDTSEDPGVKELDNWKELAVRNIVLLGYPCAAYAKDILEFVVYFSGGDGAPHIKLMDNVAKQFGCNLNLGKTFWATLSNIIFL